MKILAIETSSDETAAAVTQGRKIISNVVFSQIDLHREYGGIYPFLAKREHEKKIDTVIKKALKNANTKIKNIDAVAVTFGGGLVIALEVGLRRAKDLAKKYGKPLIPVDHTEGHIYSVFAQGREGAPKRDFSFPFLALIVSGGTTKLIWVEGHLRYKIIGKTLDDATGEALDKAAKLMGMSYPGGPVIEELAKRGNPDFLKLPVPMQEAKDLNFSYSGLKTAFKRELEKMPDDQIAKNFHHLASSFQQVAFQHLINKLALALERKDFKYLVVGGGVSANKKLRLMIRQLLYKKSRSVYFPYKRELCTDNAAMIGIAGYFKYKKGVFIKNKFGRADRVARPELKMWMKILH